MQLKKDNPLLKDLAQIIEQGKKTAVAQVNSTLTLVFWQVGHKINTHILENKRAEYAKEIVSTVSTQLVEGYGRSFAEKNLRRMMQFANIFPEMGIVATVSRQLSWSHFVELIPLKSTEKRGYYLQKAAEENWSIRELRRQIERKAFERKEIADVQISTIDQDLQTHFKDPYFFEFLDLNQGYLEKDLETAILRELEQFILELGKSFAFVERQKRMIIDGDDFYLDLLFFNRKIRRLVAVDLKLGKFKASHKGQMELYLKWLDKHERQPEEEPPIGLILCAEKKSEQIELLEMGKDGIMVAEYWTALPPKKLLEEKLHQALVEAKARIGNQKKLGK